MSKLLKLFLKKIESIYMKVDSRISLIIKKKSRESHKGISHKCINQSMNNLFKSRLRKLAYVSCYCLVRSN